MSSKLSEEYTTIHSLYAKIGFLEEQLEFWKTLCQHRKELNRDYKDLVEELRKYIHEEI